MDRIRVEPDGSIRLPRAAMKALSLNPGSYVLVDIDDDEKTILIRKTQYDPFASAGKPSTEESFEDLLEEEDERAKRADRAFERLMENPPEVRPEDRPDLWK